MRRFYASLTFAFLLFATIFGIVGWAQRTEKMTEDDGLTLTDLGVTPEQTAQIKALWELKRQKQVQAVENLRILNRLAKDPMGSEVEIRETLKNLRKERLKQEQKIKAFEDELIKTLPPRAQLHLTILGVLDNGLALRRLGGSQKKEERDRENNNGHE